MACGTAATNLSVQPGLPLRQQSDPWHQLSLSFFTHQDHSLFLLFSWPSSKSHLPCQPVPMPRLSLLPADLVPGRTTPGLLLGTGPQRRGAGTGDGGARTPWRARVAAQGRALRQLRCEISSAPTATSKNTRPAHRGSQTAPCPLWHCCPLPLRSSPSSPDSWKLLVWSSSGKRREQE